MGGVGSLGIGSKLKTVKLFARFMLIPHLFIHIYIMLF